MMKKGRTIKDEIGYYYGGMRFDCGFISPYLVTERTRRLSWKAGYPTDRKEDIAVAGKFAFA